MVEEFEKHNLDHKVVVLPCGHYTMGETPYKYMDGWQLAKVFGRRLGGQDRFLKRRKFFKILNL